ncbi:polysaccharide biosynthesis protein [Clostridium tagluense]|uniref:polysaccharide biosynthesis protein n=1 Tax=Clostridium TaxID=1485 RepID=UPI0013E999A8|nr:MULTISPECIES: nucleoside-diphosphate sugar epimerase/dehydratase [Clostridium]MBW9155781.1 polysaccharide biosynthesis protein [Clostridium tagluense]MBZ9623942.1 polysaccharide biosynthesis protein [Clostridium sp. FP2]MBZ9635321.1 polysaccharide biosynthesis protein [Clostridium sp. FP1]MCB2299669.1 polysaccharide biosynthesis protein [Clostridium tagluense]MCB2311701.1 polysaccharide biosynthesis protein [Clostridium tagluense]
MKTDRRVFAVDIVCVLASLYISLLLKFDFNIPGKDLQFFKLSIVPVLILIIGFNKIFKLYRSIWKYASIKELFSIVYSISLANVAFVIYSYLVSYILFKSAYYRFPFTVHIIFWLLCIITLGGIRIIYRISEQKKGENKQCDNNVNILIVGAGDAGALLVKEISKHSELKYYIVGLIDDDSSKKDKIINGIKVLGGRDKIISICQQEAVEEIIITMPSADFKTKTEILNICKKTKCKLKTIPGIYEIVDEKVNISELRDVNIEDLLGRDPVKLSTEDIDKYIKGKTILVTGGGGSIGSELCRQIAKFNPKKLIVLDIYENNAYDLQMELNYEFPQLNKEFIIASVRDIDRLKEIFENHKPDVVFHAAAHKHVPLMENNPAEAIKNNVIGTYNVVKCSHEAGVKRFVQISTDKAVNPTNIMGATKRFCELIIQAFDTISDTEYVAVRFGNVLGSNGSVIPLFKKQIAHGGPVTVMHPDINRFFMTIPEAAQLVIQAGGMAKGGEIFVLDMGEPVKIVDLARGLITLSGLEPDVDIKIEFIGLRPGEKLYEELLMDEVALTSTSHNKIYVEKPIGNDIDFIEKSIEDFKNVVGRDKEAVFALMEEKVPTYKRKMN